MRKLRVYIETSVVSFYEAEDAPREMADTREFFDAYVAMSAFEAFISPVVVDELAKTPDLHRREKLLAVVRRYPLTLLPLTPEEDVYSLADVYIQSGIIPPAKLEDALHVAVCTVNEIDVLVSWNYRHLANVNRERRIAGANQSQGYCYPLRITTPLEVMDRD